MRFLDSGFGLPWLFPPYVSTFVMTHPYDCPLNLGPRFGLIFDRKTRNPLLSFFPSFLAHYQPASTFLPFLLSPLEFILFRLSTSHLSWFSFFLSSFWIRRRCLFSFTFWTFSWQRIVGFSLTDWLNWRMWCDVTWRDVMPRLNNDWDDENQADVKVPAIYFIFILFAYYAATAG